MRYRLLIVEDDDYLVLEYKERFEAKGMQVTTASEYTDAVKTISNNTFDYVILDHDLHGMPRGLELLDLCLQRKMSNVSILTSNEDDDELAEKYLSFGAKNFFLKSYFFHNFNFIYQTITNTIDDKKFQSYFADSFITTDEDLKASIRKVATYYSKSVIHITGPSGSGKGQLARLIHEMSGRKGKFKIFDATKFEGNEFIAELFGHVKGAFTGAISDKDGVIEQAAGGTLFIDEIGKIPRGVQSKLLKFFDDKIVEKWGAKTGKKIDVKIITASKENLSLKVSNGDFLEDLFYRLATSHQIKLKPLRKNRQDIPLLINYFMKSIPEKIIIKPEARKKLLEYDWDGNIRQLKNVVESFADSKAKIINEENLDPRIIQNIPLLDDSTENFILTDEQEKLIEKMGLTNYVNKLQALIYKRKFTAFKNKSEVNRRLGISQQMGKRIYKIMKEEFNDVTIQ